MAGVDLSRINTNVGAINMLSTLKSVNKELAMHQTRLATGKKINSAADDPAGLTLGLKMQKQSDHLQQAMDNIGDGQNLLSVAEGGLTSINDILGKMRVKAEQAANDTMGTDERNAIANDLKEYAKEIDDTVKSTTWNDKKLLDGLANETDWGSDHKITLQTGVTTDETTTLTGDEFDTVAVDHILRANVASATTVHDASVSAPAGAANFTTARETLATSDTTLGLNELDSGTYTVKITVGTTNNATGATFSLYRGDGTSGEALQIDNGAGATGTSSTISTLTTQGSKDYDTGRGVTFTLASGGDMDQAGTYTLTFAYTKEGDYTFDVGTADKARTTMDSIDSAIKDVSDRLDTLGSLQSRLDFKNTNLGTAKVNTQAAYSRLMDSDMAEEQLGATRGSILQQTATTMLAQANQAPQAVLRLFQ